MERRLESIQIKYWHKYVKDEQVIRNVTSVIVVYRNIVDEIPQKMDTIVISKDTDYSGYEEKIRKICQIAFEEQ